MGKKVAGILIIEVAILLAVSSCISSGIAVPDEEIERIDTPPRYE